MARRQSLAVDSTVAPGEMSKRAAETVVMSSSGREKAKAGRCSVNTEDKAITPSYTEFTCCLLLSVTQWEVVTVGLERRSLNRAGDYCDATSTWSRCFILKGNGTFCPRASLPPLYRGKGVRSAAVPSSKTPLNEIISAGT